MYKIANLSNRDREILFNNSASKLSLTPIVIEKDFWITVILDYLFNKSKFKDLFVFKGGTCLSKCWKIVNRFSEDIDLVLKWDAVGYTSEEATAKRSSKQRELFKTEIRQKTQKFLLEDFVPTLNTDFKQLFKSKVEAKPDLNDSRVIYINYPNIFSNPSIPSEIKLEIGCLSSIKPKTVCCINSYASEAFPENFILGKTNVASINCESIFWEKVLILHQTALKAKMSDRMSRHYYDLACLCKTPVKDKALKETKLFNQALDMTQMFYYLASLNNLTIQKLNLIPNEQLINDLSKDYEKTKNMLLDKTIPEFSEILNSIKGLQAELKK